MSDSGDTEIQETPGKEQAGAGKIHSVVAIAKRGARHALFPMLALVVFSLIVDETYPFSDFPMYSRLPDNTVYFYVADGEGKALPVKDCFGVSASAMKKMYIKRLVKVAKERTKERGYGIPWMDLPPEDHEAIGNDLLDYLLPRGEEKAWWKKNKPDAIQLVRVDIKRSDAEGLVETPVIIVERPLDK